MSDSLRRQIEKHVEALRRAGDNPDVAAINRAAGLGAGRATDDVPEQQAAMPCAGENDNTRLEPIRDIHDDDGAYGRAMARFNPHTHATDEPEEYQQFQEPIELSRKPPLTSSGPGGRLTSTPRVNLATSGVEEIVKHTKDSRGRR